MKVLHIPSSTIAPTVLVRRSSQPDQSHRKENHPPAPKMIKPASTCLPIAGHWHAKPGNLQLRVGRKILDQKKQHTKTDTDSARERVASSRSPNTVASGCADGAKGA